MFKFQKNHKIQKVSVFKSKLPEAQTILAGLNFELLEIWSPDEGNDTEVWVHAKSKKTIHIIVIENEDASRDDVVNELIDIWYEIRDLKEGILSIFSEEDELLASETVTPEESFRIKVLKTAEEWSSQENVSNFIYNKNIDPTVLTYLNMSEEEKLKITH